MTLEKAIDLKCTFLKDGDVLIARMPEPLGRSCVFPLKGEHKYVTVVDVAILRVNKNIVNNHFISLIINSHQSRASIVALKSGTTRKRISRKNLDTICFPLPPLPEQHRIVAKIEESFSNLDKGVESLKTAQQQIEVYRKAVLKWAFEGKLTEEWRKAQKELPSKKELLEDIIKARNKKTNMAQKKNKKIIPLEVEENSELYQLPTGWVWVKLGDITWSVKDGPHYSPQYQLTGVPFISGGNIRPDGVDFTNVKYISPELNKELSKRCMPEYGDILYTKGGTTGIARVNTYGSNFNVWVHVAVLKLIENILPFYVQHSLNSPHCYKQSQKYTHGVGNQDLGLTRMVNITMPMCSFKEQVKLVQEIESRLSVCDKLEEAIEQSLIQSEALRQSILIKAFEGKLVPQDPNDEPVEDLLKRIRDEKVAQLAEKPTKRGTKK
jgi:type I restriction enzyme S subunit